MFKENLRYRTKLLNHTSSSHQSCAQMSLLDRISGDLKLYIGGLVTTTTTMSISRSPRCSHI